MKDTYNHASLGFIGFFWSSAVSKSTSHSKPMFKVVALQLAIVTGFALLAWNWGGVPKLGRPPMAEQSQSSGV
jgi:hypothetical protein